MNFWTSLVHRIWREKTERALAEVEEARDADNLIDRLHAKAVGQLWRSERNKSETDRILEENHLVQSIHLTITEAFAGRKEREA